MTSKYIKLIFVKFLVVAASYAGAIWTFIEFSSFSIKAVREALENHAYVLISVLLISSLAALIHVWPKHTVEHEFKSSNTKITIKLGDIFEEDNPICIPTSDYFETNYSAPGPSLKAQMINKIYQSNTQHVADLIHTSLKSQGIIPPNQRQKDELSRFEPGTTVIIPANKYGDIFVTVFTSVTERGSDKITETTPYHYSIALVKLWEKYRNNGRQKDLSIPVFGSGLTASGFSVLLLMQTICISFALYSKKNKITNNLKIIVPHNKYDPSLFFEIESFLKTIEI